VLVLELELLEGAVEAEQAEPASTVVTSMRGFTLALALVLSEKAISCERDETDKHVCGDVPRCKFAEDRR